VIFKPQKEKSKAAPSDTTRLASHCNAKEQSNSAATLYIGRLTDETLGHVVTVDFKFEDAYWVGLGLTSRIYTYRHSSDLELEGQVNKFFGDQDHRPASRLLTGWVDSTLATPASAAVSWCRYRLTVLHSRLCFMWVRTRSRSGLSISTGITNLDNHKSVIFG
jgi:hypothetical protein